MRAARLPACGRGTERPVDPLLERLSSARVCLLLRLLLLLPALYGSVPTLPESHFSSLARLSLNHPPHVLRTYTVCVFSGRLYSPFCSASRVSFAVVVSPALVNVVRVRGLAEAAKALLRVLHR